MENIFMHMLIPGLVTAAVLFFLMWLLYLKTNNAGVVDIMWGFGFVVLGFLYMQLGAGASLRNLVLFALVGLWGMRLTIYVIRRIFHEKIEDKRYSWARTHWAPHIELKFLGFFLLQALWQVIIALPFIVIALNPAKGLSFMEIVGAVVFLAALYLESVADQQLFAFKKDPSNKGKVCDVGLWAYSRHPNYFFEWIIWIGLGVFALASPGGWIGIVSPAIMFVLLRFVTGVPPAETQALASRGDAYRLYQQKTPAFFPRLGRIGE